MNCLRFAGQLLTACCLAAGTGSVFGQIAPGKVIRIVVGVTAGSLDITGRVIADGISASMGQTVIVDNRPNVTIAAEIVAKAPPDGHTLLMTGSNLWLLPLMKAGVSYDPLRDFYPLTLATKSPSILVVHPSLPVRSVRQLVALAKARPGDLSYGSGAVGSASHLAAELFRVMTGVKMLHVPYRSSPRGLIDLIGGHIQIMFPVAASVAPYLAAGKLRGLAVTSTKPSVLVPELPTMAAAGLPGYEAISIAGVFAPAKLPEATATQLNREIVRVLQKPDIKEKFLRAGVETVGSTSGEFADTVKTEMTRMGKVIKEAGIRVR